MELKINGSLFNPLVIMICFYIYNCSIRIYWVKLASFLHQKLSMLCKKTCSIELLKHYWLSEIQIRNQAQMTIQSF